MTDKLRQAIEQAVAILGPEAPLCSGCVEEWAEALRVLNEALAEQPAEKEPVAWMTYESKHRLSNGGNCKGAVPVHKNPSHASCVPLYTAPQPAKQPLIADEICDSWEFITGHQIQFGPSSEGRQMYLSFVAYGVWICF